MELFFFLTHPRTRSVRRAAAASTGTAAAGGGAGGVGPPAVARQVALELLNSFHAAHHVEQKAAVALAVLLVSFSFFDCASNGSGGAKSQKWATRLSWIGRERGARGAHAEAARTAKQTAPSAVSVWVACLGVPAGWDAAWPPTGCCHPPPLPPSHPLPPTPSLVLPFRPFRGPAALTVWRNGRRGTKAGQGRLPDGLAHLGRKRASVDVVVGLNDWDRGMPAVGQVGFSSFVFCS